MPLSSKKVGVISAKVLRQQLQEQKRLVLDPTDVRKDVEEFAKKYDLEIPEAAAFCAVLLQEAFADTMAVLSDIEGDWVEQHSKKKNKKNEK